MKSGYQVKVDSTRKQLTSKLSSQYPKLYVTQQAPPVNTNHTTTTTNNENNSNNYNNPTTTTTTNNNNNDNTTNHSDTNINTSTYYNTAHAACTATGLATQATGLDVLQSE